MTKHSDPLRGPALAGYMAAGFHERPGERPQVYVLLLPSEFGLLWRGRDGIARAGVGKGTKDTAEVRYALLKDFSEEEHLGLLSIFDGFGKQSRWCRNEASLGEMLAAARLDAPP
jgi:hypothetical protein